MRTFSQPRRMGGQVSGRVVAGTAVVAVVLLAAVYLLRPKPEPEPLPVPESVRSAPLETVAPAQSAQERGDSAREIIAALRADPGGVEYSRAYQRAQEFQASGNMADAQLLYFFAARGGDPQAAFALATMYDPIHFSSDSSVTQQPDVFQAYKWYRSALDAGDSAAADRLEALRTWANKAAAAGDRNAETLILQWE